MKIRVIYSSNKRIPISMHKLTRGDHGLMKRWLNNLDKPLHAAILLLNDQPIGWACARLKDGYFYMGTYIHHEHRSKGYGQLILDKLIKSLKRRYKTNELKMIFKAPEDAHFFNKTYQRIIEKHGCAGTEDWFYC